MIRDLAAGGTTIVLTTHYLDEAEALADRVAVIAAAGWSRWHPPTSWATALSSRPPSPGAAPTGPWLQLTSTPTKLVMELADEFGEIPALTVTRPTLRRST